MEEKLEHLLQLVEKKLNDSREIMNISNEVLKLASESCFEEAYELLDKRGQFLVSVSELDKEIMKASHDIDLKRSGKLKKVLAMNEPDNLLPEERKLALLMQAFASVMKSVMELNGKIKREFERGKIDMMSELSSIGDQKKKLMHSKQFVSSGLGPEDLSGWNMKL